MLNPARIYMCEGDYDKDATLYNKLGTFYIFKGCSNDIFQRLLTTNRISIPQSYYTLYNCITTDKIYIRALYYCSGSTTHLLICNDARRKIASLYKLRIEEYKFKDRLLLKISMLIGHCGLPKLLKDNFAFTAGSFPLQVFLDVNWHNSDLDIFVMSEPGYKNIITFLRSICVTEKNLSTSDDTNTYKLLGNVYECTLPNNFRIQVIQSYKTTIENVISEFDFDFCKIAWCFNEDRLVIANRHSIETKTCHYKSSNTYHKSSVRLEKYQQRGFTVTNWEKMLENEKQSKTESNNSN